MHLAQAYTNRQVTSGAWHPPLTTVTLRPKDAQALTQALNQDASNYIFLAWVSFADAVRGVQQCFYSWATVKTYYCLFYALRARLALHGFGIVYEGKKARGFDASPGTTFEKLSGNTHKVVLDRFAKKFPAHVLVSQTIGTLSPLDWMMERREAANYRDGRFCEPLAPAHFSRIESIGLRKALNAYCSDKTLLYAFDPEHAILAFPLAVLHDVQNELRGRTNLRMESEALSFLRTGLKDSSGGLVMLTELLRAVAPP